MSGRNALLGNAEVQSLIGAWQSIIGSGAADPFRDILGAETYYRGQQAGGRWGQPHHHHHHGYGYGGGGYGGYGGYGGGYPQQAFAPYAAPYAAPAPAPYAPAYGGYARDHRQGGAWVGADDDGGMTIGPRNELVDRPGPTRADRVLLPMSSGVNILPNTSAQITSRPQNVAFRPERVIIGGTPGDWIVNDIKVGNRSQFSQSGDVPGEVFANNTIDAFVSFETVQTAMDFVMLVTFIGASESGAPFFCAVLGTAAL